MALDTGTIDATSGMSKAIFDQLDQNLMSAEDKNKLEPADLDTMRASWKKLAYSIAKGVTDYLVANMEVNNIQTKGNISATIIGNTATGGADMHVHSVNLTANQMNDVFTQSNNGTGHIK